MFFFVQRMNLLYVLYTPSNFVIFQVASLESTFFLQGQRGGGMEVEYEISQAQ